MKKTKIEWCDSTWNPVTGCLHTCEYCYARNMAHRFCFDPWQDVENGKTHFVGMPMQNQFYKNNRIDPYPYGFDPTLHTYRLEEPSKWLKPRRIFVCSMSDLFGDWVPDEWILEVLAACRKAPQHTYIFLTKNPKGYKRIESLNIEYQPNWWLGTTTTDNSSFLDTGFYLWQTTTEMQINTDARIKRFLSCEPLLGEIDPNLFGAVGNFDWLILGAETGNRKGKIIPKKEWITALTEACDRTGTPVFMKNSLIPVIGEENMRREFPKEMQTGGGWRV